MKKNKYRLTQGQLGTQPAAGGFMLDQPQVYIGSIASTATASAIRSIWTAPSWIPADALVSNFSDDEPNTQPDPRFSIQAIRFLFDTSQASAATDNPTITLQRYDSTGASLGTIYALDLGTTAVTAATPIVVPASSFTTASNALLNVGDSVREYISNGASALGIVPGHVLSLDVQA